MGAQKQRTPIRVLVAGGAYGGISFVVNLLDLCSGRPARSDYENTEPSPEALKGVDVDIHIVDERDGYLHLIGSPLAFASNKYAPSAWVKFDDVPALQHPSVRWSQASLKNVDTERMVASIEDVNTHETSEHEYDYFIAGTGLRRIFPVVPQSLTHKTYVQECADHVKSVQNATQGVVVIGGGAVGIEMAAELKVVEPSVKVTLIQSRDTLLAAEPLPAEAKQMALDCSREVGVEVVLGRGRVTSTSTTAGEDGKPVQKLTLQDGTIITASHVINAVSQQIPTATYLDAKYKDSEGLIVVNSLLQISGTDEHHYAVGDIAKWSGIKRCGAAIAMGSRVADTVFQQILHERAGTENKPEQWPEVPPMIALACGKKAMVYSPATGPSCSEEEMERFFSNDLGFKGCWDHMGLSEPWKIDSPQQQTAGGDVGRSIPQVEGY